jgi:hypothetical protein
MKTVLYFFIVPALCIAQHDFTAANGRITWARVFNESVTVENLGSYLLKEFPHETVQLTAENSITGNTSFAAVFTDRAAWPFYYNPPVRFTYNVDFKDNRYRVTINNVVLKNTDDEAVPKDDTFLDKRFLRVRGGDIRTNPETTKLLERLHNAFVNRFTYKEPAGW